MKDWYYAQYGQKHGPVSKSELLDLIKSGDVDRDDLVWTSGMDDWEPAGSVNGLLTSDANAPPPPSEAIDDPKTHSKDSGAADIANDNKDEPSTDSNVEYAGFWKRFFAFIVDIIILTFASVFISIPLISGSTQAEIQSITNLVGMIIGWLYYASMESSNKQATLGKLLLGIKVTDEEGEKVGFGKATGRHFGKIVSGIIFMIGYIMAAFTEKKQALHDKMAGCLVVNK